MKVSEHEITVKMTLFNKSRYEVKKLKAQNKLMGDGKKVARTSWRSMRILHINKKRIG